MPWNNKTFAFLHAFIVTAIIVRPWKIVPVSVRYLFYQPMDEKIKTWTLHFPAKENPNMEKELFNWPIVLQYDVKAKYWLFSRKFSSMKFFHLSVHLTNQKPCAFDLLNKRVKLLYFHSFVVSVLFAHFHFKVIWKSLYQVYCFKWMVSIQKKLHF